MMKRHAPPACILLYLLLLTATGIAQDSPGPDRIPDEKLTQHYFKSIHSKSEKYSEQFVKETDKYLARLRKQEELLQRKLQKIDSIAANNIFAHSANKYREIQEKVKSKTGRLLNGDGRYLAWLDTLNTSLKFLESVNPSIAKIAGTGKQLKETMSCLKEMERQLKEAENIKEFVRQRKQYLNEQFAKYGLVKELKKFNKEAWYYGQQLSELRQAWEDPSRMEQKLIGLLKKIPLFQKFMEQYGELAGLFTVPADYAQNMSGLQTLNMVQTQLQQRITGMGPNAAQMVQQNLQAAQAGLSQLRDRVRQYGQNGGGDLPDFKPSQMRTRSFLKRLELGTNFQSVRANTYFPLRSDLGLSLGYRATDNAVLGVGMSYRVGWGKDIRHINITHEGLGIRSFAEYKIHGTFFMSAGAEWNYNSSFKRVEALKNYTAWSRRALAGLNKKYELGKKWKGNVMVLYDFLWRKNALVNSPWVVRTGYRF
jgi:hypothetical protein